MTRPMAVQVGAAIPLPSRPSGGINQRDKPMSITSNGPPADGSNPLTGPSGWVKTVYKDGEIESIEIHDDDAPSVVPHKIWFFRAYTYDPCEHTRRKEAEFKSKWSKFLPIAIEAATNGSTPDAPADCPQLPAILLSGNGTAAPSWNKETMTLSYKGKATTFDKRAKTVPKVFGWFQDAGWLKTVKIQDYDVIENGAQISNLVSRARAKALEVGFTIKRSGDELEWAEKRNQQGISVNCDADSS